MSLWFRAGPLGVSSRGRVGLRVGPVSYTTSGRHRQSQSDALGWVALFCLLLILAIIIPETADPASQAGWSRNSIRSS